MIIEIMVVLMIIDINVGVSNFVVVNYVVMFVIVRELCKCNFVGYFVVDVIFGKGNGALLWLLTKVLVDDLCFVCVVGTMLFGMIEFTCWCLGFLFVE